MVAIEQGWRADAPASARLPGASPRTRRIPLSSHLREARNRAFRAAAAVIARGRGRSAARGSEEQEPAAPVGHWEVSGSSAHPRRFWVSDEPPTAAVIAAAAS